MADNNKVTIDAAWFAELWKIANEADKVCEDCVREKCGECKIVKERDELKAKCEAMHSQEQEWQDLCNKYRNQVEVLNKALKDKDDICNGNCGRVNHLKKRLAAAERCIEEAFEAWTNEDGTDASYNRIGDIIRAYREKEDAAR